MKAAEGCEKTGTLGARKRRRRKKRGRKRKKNRYFFFFKQKTAYEIYQCDWSSDVCSSDLAKLKDRFDNRFDVSFVKTSSVTGENVPQAFHNLRDAISTWIESESEEYLSD